MPNQKKMVATTRKARKQRVPRMPGLTFRPMNSARVNVVFKQEKNIVEASAGLGAMTWYRINGAYDPDQSAVGGSALGFNNYAALFTMYRVLAMRIRIEGIVGAAAAGNHLSQITLMPNARQVTAPTDPALWAGQYMAKSGICVYSPNGGKNTITLDATYLPWEVMKISKATYMSDLDYASLVTTTPAIQAYVGLGVNSIGTASVASLYAFVTISYDIEFFEPSVLT